MYFIPRVWPRLSRWRRYKIIKPVKKVLIKVRFNDVKWIPASQSSRRWISVVSTPGWWRLVWQTIDVLEDTPFLLGRIILTSTSSALGPHPLRIPLTQATPHRIIKACTLELWSHQSEIERRHLLDTSAASVLSLASCPINAWKDARHRAQSKNRS